MSIKQHLILFLAILATTIGYGFDSSDFNVNKKMTGMILGSTATLATIGYLGYQYAISSAHPMINVHNLDQHHAHFPTNFTWGVATSGTQNEEDSLHNSWTKKYLLEKNKPNLFSPGFACKSWTEWKDDIDKAAYLGVQSYRLSIEWSRVQPTPDHFDHAAIAHYVEICKMLTEKGISPMICLHHYSDPIWFLEQGGFSRTENITIFTKFCKKMYKALRPFVSQWIIISQPAAYAVKGYDQAMQPPFLKSSGLAEITMLNLFKAHIQVYDMMHTMYAETSLGLEPQVGICHQITQMQAHTSYNPLEHLVANFADRLYNKSLLRFFSTGHFRCLKPMIDLAYIPNAPTKFDFFALSYYCPKSFMGINPVTPRAEKSHQTADLSRIIDKDGMYDAILQAAKLGKPVYVVESGIDPVDETQRILLLNSYLSAISQAIKDGYDIRGYYHWTLMDNYEWGKPKDATHFGLFKNRVINDCGDLDENFKNHELMLKESGKYYKNIIGKQTTSLALSI